MIRFIGVLSCAWLVLTAPFRLRPSLAWTNAWRDSWQAIKTGSLWPVKAR
jgi:hypothetical protein